MGTKKIFITLVCLFQMMMAFAVKKSITMVSYEQSIYEATLALKNNTNEEVKNVSFMITYLDMSGNELDYEEFYREISIKPGKTKKLKIPAFENHSGYYDEMESSQFKVKFQLLDYNSNGLIHSNGSDNLEIIIFVVGLLLVIVFLAFYPLVAILAKQRDRNVIVWVLLGIFINPIIIAIILLCIGKEEKKSQDSSYKEEVKSHKEDSTYSKRELNYNKQER